MGVNGNPVCARPPNKIGEYAELGNVTRASVKSDEEEFIKVIEGRVKGADGKLKVIDVAKKESDIEVKDLVTLSKVMEGLKEKYPGLVHNRVPVCNSAAPVPVLHTGIRPSPVLPLMFRDWPQSGCRVAVAIPVGSVNRFFLASIGLAVVIVCVILRPVDCMPMLLVVVLLLVAAV